MLDLTVYAGARTHTPHEQPTLSWAAFCDEVAALCREETAFHDKRDLPAFGPYRLRAGATRSAANVERMAAVAAIDVDEELDLAALRDRLRELGCAAIVHGSPSDDPAGVRKARVYVQLDATHAPEDAGHVRASVAALLGVTPCASTANSDRVFFCGRLAGTPERFVERFDGAPVALATLPPPDKYIGKPISESAADRDAAPAYDAATLAILGALGPWQDYAGRKHAVVVALGGVLRKTTGWSKDACAELVRAWLPANEPGVDVAAAVASACRAWALPPAECSGQTALAAAAGERAAAVICEAALLPWRARQCAPTEAAPGDAPVGAYATLRAVDRTQPPRQLAYVVEALGFAPGKVSAIQAYAYCGKTPFALLLAISVAAGRDFLGMAVTQRPTAFINFEGEVLCEEREARICAGLGLDRAAVPLHLFHAEDALSDAMLADLDTLLSTEGIGLIVLDTYSSALPADVSTFNDASFRTWATALGRISDRTNACVVILTHETKTAQGQAGLRGISGHGSLAGAVQAAVSLDRPDEATPNVIEVRCARATRKAFDPFRVKWSDRDDGALVATRVGGAVAAPSKRGANLATSNAARTACAAQATLVAGRAIMRDAPITMTQRKELIALSGGNDRAAKRALERLVGAGLLTCVAGAYSRTPQGTSATPIEIATALGSVAGFNRETP